MMDLQHPNRGHREYHKARFTLLCGLVIAVCIEIFIFLYFGCILGSTHSDGLKTNTDLSVGQSVLTFDETAEWKKSVLYVSDVLEINHKDADDVLHQIADVYQSVFQRQLYFCNEFECIDGVENHYSVSDGDAYARFEVEIKDNKVKYVKELSFDYDEE